MLYRIIFDPKMGVWLIQIQQYLVLWASVCASGKALGFSSYDLARAWVTSTGLDKAYRNLADAPAAGYIR